jgi:hypothetical protein
MLSASPTTVIAEMRWLPEQRPAASRPSSPPVTAGESGHVSIAGADLARMAELVHACADQPPGAAGAPVIAAVRLKLTGAATLDLRHFTVVHPPTHSRPEPPATDAGRAARQAPGRAACHAPPQNLNTLPEPPRRTPAAARCRAHGGMQITVIRTAARVAIATDRIRICRIAGVANRIFMHNLAYSVEGLIGTMIAELVWVISL